MFFIKVKSWYFKGRVHDFDFGFFGFFFSQHWLGTYERPSNPPRNSFYITLEASYGRFTVFDENNVIWILSFIKTEKSVFLLLNHI